jgi:hypothetical protein
MLSVQVGHSQASHAPLLLLPHCALLLLLQSLLLLLAGLLQAPPVAAARGAAASPLCQQLWLRPVLLQLPRLPLL